MAWSTIRKATQEDYAVLNKAARRFADHHNLDTSNFSDRPWYERVDAVVEGYAEYHRDPNDVEHWDAMRLANLWRRVVRRALKEPSTDGIAYGYVGSHVD